MKSIEQKIFEKIDAHGECLQGNFHIIDQTEVRPTFEGEKSYRIYHNAGYCIDVIKEANKYNEETGKVLSWTYDIRQNWPEFAEITAHSLQRLITNEFK